MQTRRTCAEVSAYRKILPWQRCAALNRQKGAQRKLRHRRSITITPPHAALVRKCPRTEKYYRPAVRCIEFAPAKIKDFARGPRLLSTPLFRRLQNLFRSPGSSATSGALL